MLPNRMRLFGSQALPGHTGAFAGHADAPTPPATGTGPGYGTRCSQAGHRRNSGCPNLGSGNHTERQRKYGK